jgi:hypothetical protein
MEPGEEISYRYILFEKNLILQTETVISRSPWMYSISLCKREATIKRKDASNNPGLLATGNLDVGGKFLLICEKKISLRVKNLTVTHS